MRRSDAPPRVLDALLDDPDGQHSAYDLWRRSGVRSAVLHRILDRLIDQGLVADVWEEQQGSRRPRHFYRLTPNGRAEADALMREALQDRGFVALLGGTA
jgi:DNA-binding PadR family transcriptional regulator